MTNFPIHTVQTAPEASKPLLEAVKGKFGIVPNLLGEFAESPTTLKAYLELSATIGGGTLSPLEQQVVQITASVLNGCHYCVAAHSTIADGQKLSREVIDAVRANQPLADKKLEALRQFTITVVNARGWATAAEVAAFLGAGYSKAHVLEVVLSVALKTISNYANHLMDTPVDQAFSGRAIDLTAYRKAS